ncbi:aminomethyl-transferring glycine dehydrogenase subunit GcvPA [Hathewaya massiliensis]|uniref:aminomethyl-transferring glycine dehydrogenase subunit GcvPA n=1 Tax=Hathewaya massiliensis TaxID=1964382 RepID=UPI001158DEC5|nr:aminomethyl-transferring glycine dehydrogenase subunit GcvPA [Hathewaya massiliensis]
MFPYIPLTKQDEEKMLKTIGVSSVAELFSDVPEDVKLNRRLDLEAPKSELEVSSLIKEISNQNIGSDELVSFLGAGSYDRYIPSVIKHILSRAEFYTSYTPYQPEISQGTLQAIFEFQSMITRLTGMEVSNASMYDGQTACAEAAMLACASTKKKNIVVSKTVHPETRKLLKTYGRFNGFNVEEVDMLDGVTDIEKLKSKVNKETAGVIVQNPNFFGIIEPVEEVEKITHETKALLIMSVEPISLGVLKTPAEYGADIAVGDAQGLGGALNFGGPYLGFMNVTKKLTRKMPGRIVGQTQDVDGKRAFVLTLQAREQHIRREKATSNICSDQGLMAVGAAVYCSILGKEGIKEVAMQSLKKAHYAHNELIKSGKYKPLFNQPFFNEFALVGNKNAEDLNKELLNKGILGGFNLEKEYPELKNSFLLCVTEKRTREEIDNLVKSMEVI